MSGSAATTRMIEHMRAREGAIAAMPCDNLPHWRWATAVRGWAFVVSQDRLRKRRDRCLKSKSFYAIGGVGDARMGAAMKASLETSGR
jgi:hypothetical protein